MINLIPTSAKKGVVREYWLRVTAVWMFLAGTACLLVASLMLPTYMLLAARLSELQVRIDEQASLTSSYDTNASALTEAMKTANTLLATSTNDTPFLLFQRTLRESAGNGIQIDHIQFTRKATTTAIKVSGVSKTRQDLADFRDKLEQNPLFINVVLPIASLIKDRDVTFDMNLQGIATTTTPTP